MDRSISDTEEDDDIIHIDISVFDTQSAESQTPGNAQICKRVRDILDSYSCFSPPTNYVASAVNHPFHTTGRISMYASAQRHPQDPPYHGTSTRGGNSTRGHHGRHIQDSWKSPNSSSVYGRASGVGSSRGVYMSSSHSRKRQALACTASSSAFLKQVTSFLNRMSPTNFDKLSGGIIDLIINGVPETNLFSQEAEETEETEESLSGRKRMEDVFDLVIAKSYREHGYICLSCRLIKVIVAACVVSLEKGECATEITLDTFTQLDKFVEESISGFLTDDFDMPNVEDYDAFCASNRLTHCAMGRNVMIINLVSNRLVNINRESYFEIIISRMFNQAEPDKRAELALEFVMKYIEYFKDLIASERELVEDLFDRFYGVECVGGAQRVRFKVMAIHDIVYGRKKAQGRHGIS
eukprot:gene29482-5828_t